MLLRGIEFGTIYNASGARGFFGEGTTSNEYWHHNYFAKYLGLDYTGSTFVAKTITRLARDGNLPLDNNYCPIDWYPKCVKIKPFKKVVLNSVGLSNPGLAAILATNKWQTRQKPFVISFAATGKTKSERLRDTIEFALCFCDHLPMSAPIALQINMSCPNVKSDELINHEIESTLEILNALNIPLILKFNAIEPIVNLMGIESHPALDAIAINNTIPYGYDGIDWVKLFGSKHSTGGLSGAPLLPLAIHRVKLLREYKFSKPIIAGGGVLSADNAKALIDAGATGIELGVVGLLRPWRVRHIINSII